MTSCIIPATSGYYYMIYGYDVGEDQPWKEPIIAWKIRDCGVDPIVIDEELNNYLQNDAGGWAILRPDGRVETSGLEIKFFENIDAWKEFWKEAIELNGRKRQK